MGWLSGGGLVHRAVGSDRRRSFSWRLNGLSRAESGGGESESVGQSHWDGCGVGARGDFRRSD